MDIQSQRLLREQEAAKLLDVSVYWLQRQRWQRSGPCWIRVGGPTGRAIRYRIADLLKWIDGNAVQRADIVGLRK